MMDRSLLGAAGTALFLVVVAVTSAAPRVERGAFELHHFDSALEFDNATQQHGFREVFVVTWVDGRGGAPKQELVVTRDGEPWAIDWGDVDVLGPPSSDTVEDQVDLQETGPVAEGDRFTFFTVEDDTPHVLQATWNDRTVMRCRYGAGAGNPIDLETLREAGELGCLRRIGEG